MIPRTLRISIEVLFLCCFCAELAGYAQLSKEDRESAQTMIAGTLYLRLDVPCR